VSRALEDGEKFKQLVVDFHAGRVGRAELAAEIHAHSTSISLEWLVDSLQGLFPDIRITTHEGLVPIGQLCATQAVLEKAKYELVCLLFDEEATFDSYNREFFDDHPVTVIRVGGGSYAILDGHHRVRRFAELTGGARPMSVTVISSHSLDPVHHYRQQVEAVRRAAGSADVRDLPLVQGR